MRLRELTFPIAVRGPNILMGGKNAGLLKPSRFDFKIAEFYLKGGYDDAIIYDSEGREFEVERIFFSKTGWWHHALYRLGNFLLPNPDPSDMVDVDMELRQTRQLTLGEFCDELRTLALAHPAWWRRHSSRAEIENMFTGCQSFAEAINDIGVLDPPGKQKLPGKTSKVVDLRQSS